MNWQKMINALKIIDHTSIQNENCLLHSLQLSRYDYIHLFIYQISYNNIMMTFIQILCQKYSCEFC